MSFIHIQGHFYWDSFLKRN